MKKMTKVLAAFTALMVITSVPGAGVSSAFAQAQPIGTNAAANLGALSGAAGASVIGAAAVHSAALDQLKDAQGSAGNVVDGSGYHYGNLHKSIFSSFGGLRRIGVVRRYGEHEGNLAEHLKDEYTRHSDSYDNGFRSLSSRMYKSADTCNGVLSCAAATLKAAVAPVVAFGEYIPAVLPLTTPVGWAFAWVVAAAWVAVRTPVSLLEGLGKTLWNMFP